MLDQRLQRGELMDQVQQALVMKLAIAALLLAACVLGCAPTHGRTAQMNPDCTQVTAEEQAKGNCMYRPELPDSHSGGLPMSFYMQQLNAMV
jgi:hypothetical protein